MEVLFRDFVRAIRDSVIQSSARLENKNLIFLNSFFEKKNDEEFVLNEAAIPKKISIKYQGAIHNFEVPLVTLVPFVSYQLSPLNLSAIFDVGLLANEAYVLVGSQLAEDPELLFRKVKLELILDPLQNKKDFEIMLKLKEDELIKILS